MTFDIDEAYYEMTVELLFAYNVTSESLCLISRLAKFLSIYSAQRDLY